VHGVPCRFFCRVFLNKPIIQREKPPLIFVHKMGDCVVRQSRRRRRMIGNGFRTAKEFLSRIKVARKGWFVGRLRSENLIASATSCPEERENFALWPRQQVAQLHSCNTLIKTDQPRFGSPSTIPCFSLSGFNSRTGKLYGFGAAADSGRSQRDCSWPRRICQCGEGLAATRERNTITDFSAGAYEKRAPISTKKGPQLRP